MVIDLGFTVLNFSNVIPTLQVFLFGQPPASVVAQLFALGGWLIIAWIFLFMGLYLLEKEYKSAQFQKKWKWVILAVDVPQLNLQTPKAVELMFAHLAGAFDAPNIADKYRRGYKQRWFSFEIVSIEGYIQFLIRTEEAFRDLVEAAVYAQYPEVEITEVEDYVTDAPSTFPNETYDMWGADFGLSEDSSYPIRTYEEFEHNISKDTKFKDPMATFLESFSRIGAGEQMWFQISIEPIANIWKEKGIKLVQKLIGGKAHVKSSGAGAFLDSILSPLGGVVNELSSQILGGAVIPTGEAGADDGPTNQIQFLTPGQKTVVEAIEDKISKVGFKTKMRGIYLARKEVFNPPRGVNALLGAIKQFNVLSKNCIVPVYGVSASYFMRAKRSAYRKRVVMNAYKKRKIAMPANPCILNIEELATLWHFPMSDVRTPLLQKNVNKASEPPVGLPVEEIGEVVVPNDAGTPKPIKNLGDDKYSTDLGIGYSTDQRFG